MVEDFVFYISLSVYYWAAKFTLPSYYLFLVLRFGFASILFPFLDFFSNDELQFWFKFIGFNNSLKTKMVVLIVITNYNLPL